jgi:cellulose synthase/poly-beta-1,6-N-acetylglucosamine synthase-like glycosyltransferase
LEYLFYILIFLVFYSYIGYLLLLFVLVQLKNLFQKNKSSIIESENNDLPELTLVIPAYNEIDFIDLKMQNTLDLIYPKDKLKVIWITDGSDDGSEKYLMDKYVNANFNLKVEVHHQKERKGKSAAINRVMQFVHTPIVVFCDANTLLNKECLINVVSHFTNEKVGCVAGEKRVLNNNTNAGEGESVYWKYESLLKKLSSDFYTCIGAVGELIAFRTELFDPIPEDTILDDFVISMQIAHKGYKVVYEPNAYAQESPSENEQEEMKRKIRIASGSFQCIFNYPQWLNFFQHPLLSWQYLSHKISRWMIVPIALPLIFILNIYLFFEHPDEKIYAVLLFLQLCFYMLVIIQHFASLPSKLFRIPYYIIMMNVAMYKGFYRYIFKQQPAAWEKVKRKV